MGEAPCDVPHPDSDGVLRIDARGWEGYEHAGTPESITHNGAESNRWTVSGTEVYLGSQRDKVIVEFSVDGDVLTVLEDEDREIYRRCRKEA